MKQKLSFFIVSLLLMLARDATAQNRLQPMTLSEYKLWGERYFGTWLSPRASQQMLKFPSPMEAFPSALYVYRGYGESVRLQAKWCAVNKDAAPGEAKLKQDSIDIKTNDATALMFCELIEHAVGTCMFVGERMGFDGTRYFFGNRIRVATTWSPVGNCKELTDVLEKAMTAVRNQNEAELKGLLPEVQSLTKKFEKLYPKD